MPYCKNETLKYFYEQKLLKIPFVIYTGFEKFLKRVVIMTVIQKYDKQKK